MPIDCAAAGVSATTIFLKMEMLLTLLHASGIGDGVG